MIDQFSKQDFETYLPKLPSQTRQDEIGESYDTSQAKPNQQMAHTNNDTEKLSIQKDESYLRKNNISIQDKKDKPISTLQELPSGPNPAQQSAIETSVNSDLRVLAGPGSGKSTVIKWRYEYLVNNGVNPTSIVVVTFGKEPAAEIAKRIQKLVPQANTEQICTINALCYRLLAKWYPDSRWYRWQGPKDWQVKKTLEDTIGLVWQEKEKPSAQEISKWINSSKYLGLTTDDSYEYFVSTLGSQYGEWLYEIRSKFDAWLNRSRFLTFADQLYLTEKRLQTDSKWREMLQEKFSHVIVDEGQDTNFQAMRILITLSLESGQNSVYKNEATK